MLLYLLILLNTYYSNDLLCMYLEYADAGLLGRKFTKKGDVPTGAESVKFRRIVNLFRALQIYALFTSVRHF